MNDNRSELLRNLEGLGVALEATEKTLEELISVVRKKPELIIPRGLMKDPEGFLKDQGRAETTLLLTTLSNPDKMVGLINNLKKEEP